MKHNALFAVWMKSVACFISSLLPEQQIQLYTPFVWEFGLSSMSDVVVRPDDRSAVHDRSAAISAGSKDKRG